MFCREFAMDISLICEGRVFRSETLKKNGGGALSKQKAPEWIYMHGVRAMLIV